MCIVLDLNVRSGGVDQPLTPRKQVTIQFNSKNRSHNNNFLIVIVWFNIFEVCTVLF